MSLALVAAAPSSESGLTLNLADQAVAATASIAGGKFYGAGVIWNAERGQVLTALHVVEEMPEIWVTLPGQPAQRAALIDQDGMLDLALLQISRFDARVPKLGTSTTLRPGEAVRFAGCPRRRCGTSLGGRVGAATRDFAGSRYLELNAAVEPGMSGGPVLDARGALVGIIDLAMTRLPGIALAVPIERAIERFIDARVAKPGEAPGTMALSAR